MTTPTLTDTETTLIDSAIRSESLSDLKRYGLPTRRVESWHYTDLRAALSLTSSASELPPASLAEGSESFNRWSSTTNFLFRNGTLSSSECNSSNLAYTEMDQSELSSICSLFGTDERANAVGWINSAYASSGVNLTINKDMDSPICLSHNFHGDSNTSYAYRHKVKVEKGCKATIIDHHDGVNTIPYLTSCVTSLEVSEGASCIWVIDQEEGDCANYLSRLQLSMAKDSVVKILIINGGGNLVRQELDCVLTGEGANLQIYGANLIGGESHIDVTSCIYHQAPSTQSSELFRNIATANGKGVFQGQIRVDQSAQLTDARMACNTLLLSDTCEFSTKPELEIFADDVQCGHGATLFDLEPSYLFYLRARGIEESQARRLLITAFVASLSEELEEDGLTDALNARLSSWIDSHVV